MVGRPGVRSDTVMGSGMCMVRSSSSGIFVGRVLSWDPKKALPSKVYPNDFYQPDSTS